MYAWRRRPNVVSIHNENVPKHMKMARDSSSGGNINSSSGSNATATQTKRMKCRGCARTNVQCGMKNSINRLSTHENPTINWKNIQKPSICALKRESGMQPFFTTKQNEAKRNGIVHTHYTMLLCMYLYVAPQLANECIRRLCGD